MKCAGVLEGEGWATAYTDGSAKQVGGWWQAGYGVWFGDGSERNFSAPVPSAECQSVRRAELWGVLNALQRRRGAGGGAPGHYPRLKYVYKGITEWSVKWALHGWWARGREIGRADLWRDIRELRRSAVSQVKLIWTPSHLNVRGNDEADVLAEEGREQHPNNKRRCQREPAWVALGLSPMRLDSVGPNLSHHKARVQAVGWPPVGSQETGWQAFAPPPPKGGKGRPWRTDGHPPHHHNKASTGPRITGKTPPQDKRPEVPDYPAPIYHHRSW